MTYAALKRALNAQFLTINGAFHPSANDNAPVGTKTLVMVGPDEPRFWDHFVCSPEYSDHKADPLDRWSKRVISKVASAFEGRSVYPSDGPPFPPFITWALACGGIWPSPIGLLVHHKAGLFVSFRGAIALPEKIELPDSPISPCKSCDKPCISACPVGAFENSNYDVGKCKSYLNTDAKQTCMETGCFARRSCPVSEKYDRKAHQSAFHMASFNPQ